MMKSMRLFWLTVLLISLMTWNIKGYAADIPRLESLFDQGNSFYGSGQYEKAIITYEQILLSGSVSGHVYYNLANAYYRQGENGKAFFNYLRARTLIPRDPDLKANLEYLEKVLQINQKKNIVDQLTDYLTVNELAKLTLGIFALLVSLIFVYLYLPKTRSRIKITLYLLTVIFLFTLISTSWVIYSRSRLQQGVVIAKAVTVYFEPSETGEIFYQLTEGDRVMIDLEREGWIQVHCQDGKKGWVKTKQIAFL